MATIYVITNIINDKVYIGQTWVSLSRRMAQHRYKGRGTCIKLRNAMNKYGVDNFQINPLVECDNQMILDYLERFWITTYDSIKSGYNIREGGSHGRCSEETKKRISEAQKGKPRPTAIGNKGGCGGAKLDYTNKTWKLVNGKRIWMNK